MPFFAAVPRGTPIVAGLRKVASAGPYYVASFDEDEGALLKRNPNYHGSRPRRPRQIRFTFGSGRRQALADVESGAADYAPVTDSPTKPSEAAPSTGATDREARPRRRAGSATSSIRACGSTASRSIRAARCSPRPGCGERSTTRSTVERSRVRGASTSCFRRCPLTSTCRPACPGSRTLGSIPSGPTSRRPAGWRAASTARRFSMPSATPLLRRNRPRSSRAT